MDTALHEVTQQIGIRLQQSILSCNKVETSKYKLIILIKINQIRINGKKIKTMKIKSIYEIV